MEEKDVDTLIRAEAAEEAFPHSRGADGFNMVQNFKREGFIAGVEYRHQHPSRTMVERIVGMARQHTTDKWMSIDEIMKELEKVK